MKIAFSTPAIGEQGALIVGAPQGAEPGAIAADVGRALGGVLERARKIARFSGKRGQVVEILAPAGLGASRVVLVGLGKSSDFDGPAAERVAAETVGRLMKSGEKNATLALDLPKGAKLKPEAFALHLAFGATLRSYSFDRYRTRLQEEDKPTLAEVTVATPVAASARRRWPEFEAVASGIFLARDLVNEPPNVLSPREFARRARSLSKLGVKVEVLGETEMKKLGMGALLGVGQGSERESQLVVMQWRGGRTKSGTPVAFVGKGVCFDSGGLSLKTGAGMMGMKGDMGGAAAVVGTMHALAARKARVNAVGIAGLVENMPDGKAQRPDDVVKSMSGQTIEILNTDAEGRLVLADALWYAQTRFKPKFVVDLATLTGAIMVALGHENAGLFSNDDTLSAQIIAAGKEEGEHVWRLPLSDSYDKVLKSKIADIKNIGGPHAASITAAQFLQRFIDKRPWAHIDIAGVAWQDGEQRPLVPSWGTGWGVRVLNRLVADHYEK